MKQRYLKLLVLSMVFSRAYTMDDYPSMGVLGPNPISALKAAVINENEESARACMKYLLDPYNPDYASLSFDRPSDDFDMGHVRTPIDYEQQRHDLINGAMIVDVCRHGWETIAEELLAVGADVNVRDDNGETPLMAAIKAGCVPLIALLMSKGADYSMKTIDGICMLALARQNGQPEIIAALEHAGVHK